MERHVREKYGEKYRDWSGMNFLVALAAECAYGSFVGEKPNFELLARGDGGTDFRCGVNVKGTPVLKSPHLLLPETDEVKAEYYVLVSVDVQRRRCKLIGWAGRDEVLATTVRPFGRRRIPTRAIPCSSLHPLGGALCRATS